MEIILIVLSIISNLVVSIVVIITASKEKDNLYKLIKSRDLYEYKDAQEEVKDEPSPEEDYIPLEKFSEYISSKDHGETNDIQ